MAVDIENIQKEFAATLKKGVVINDKGIPEIEDKKSFEAVLPEGITTASINDHMAVMQGLALGHQEAIGALGVKALANNSGIDRVASEIKVGKHAKITASVSRSQTRPKSPQDRTPVTTYGVAQMGITVAATKSAAYRQLKADIAELGAKELT